MRLVVRGDSKVDLSGFINNYILRLMRSYVRSHLNTKLLDNYDINKKGFITMLFKVNYLRCQQVGNNYIIDINPNINMLNSYVKFIDICYLINYGNSSSPAYPIFSKMFSYMRKELPSLLKYHIYRR